MDRSKTQSRLSVRLLGGISVELGGKPIARFRSAKARALLAYLSTQPNIDHPRAKLATLLWGELPDDAAKTNLRIELSGLLTSLQQHKALLVNRTTVRWQSHPADESVDATIDVEVDVTILQLALKRFLSQPAEAQRNDLKRLQAALDQYTGEFLAGFEVNDAPDFEEWRLLTQEQLHQSVINALSLLQQHYAELGQWVDLANAARRQLVLVPWLESAHRSLIQALAAQGLHQLALEQFQTCRNVLRDELGVEPSLATQEILQRIQAKPTEGSNIRHNLPKQLRSLVGRQQEIERLNQLIPNERFITLLGIGGVGKSRLSQTVAQQALPHFAEGVWFVPLAGIEYSDDAPDRIALAIAATIGFAITNAASPLRELATYLANKSILLVLDNWEHLISAAEPVLETLLASEGVHVLATSRARLRLASEVVVAIDGLLVEAACTLFVERARQVVPTFTDEVSSTGPSVDLVNLCSAVSGLPLAIELLASWVEHFTVAELHRAISEIDIAVEPSQRTEMLARHQSLTKVFEHSWQLISPREQLTLANLSVFRGGFDRSAAAEIAGSQLADLTALIGHSLVQRLTAGRYDLHQLLREFAAQKLSLDPSHMSAVQDRHSRYYLAALSDDFAAGLMARRQIEADNLRGAWQHAVATTNAEVIRPVMVAYQSFVEHFGHLADGEASFAAAVNAFITQPQHRELVARLLLEQSHFVRQFSGLSAAAVLRLRVLELTQDPTLLANTHRGLANGFAELGDWAKADFHFDQAQEAARLASDPTLRIALQSVRIYINVLHFRGDFADYIRQIESLMAETKTLSNINIEPINRDLITTMAMVASRYGNYALAIDCQKQYIQSAQERGHRLDHAWGLLNLALSEQFAGMYAASIAHNHEALSMAESSGDIDDVGLLNANLCLVLRQVGQLEEAHKHGEKAIGILSALNTKRIEGQARNRLGHTLLAMQRWPEAYTAYGEALQVWATMQHPNHFEAKAGRAVAALQLGYPEEAAQLVEAVLAYAVNRDLPGIVEPARLLLNCATVLTGLEQPNQARQVLLQAQAWIEMIAARITDEDTRASFLQRPDNLLVQNLLSHQKK